MKKLLSLLVVFVGLTTLNAQRLDVPYLSGRVNDLAGVLSAQTRQTLEQKLAEHERTTSNQIAILIISSLEGEILEEYSLRVAETWKLGQKEKDNGALLLIARDDRKLRIEVGDGLEGFLTDARCSQIIRHEIVPRFKSSDYDGGVLAGVDAMLGTLEGTYVADEGDGFDEMDFEGRLIMGLVFFIVVGLFTVIGLFVPGFMGWFLYIFLMPFWFAFPLVVFGGLPWGAVPFAIFVVMFPILRLIFQRGVKSGGWQKQWSQSFAASSGSWSSGSGWSSGGSSFSGGGGSFSGGGSSGSW